MRIKRSASFDKTLMVGKVLRYQPIYAQLAEAENLLLPEAGHAMELMANAEKIITTPADIAAARTAVDLTAECFAHAKTALQTRGKPIWVEITRQGNSRFDVGVICTMNAAADDENIYMAMWLRDVKSPKQVLFCPLLIHFDLNRLTPSLVVPTPTSPPPVRRPAGLKAWLAAKREANQAALTESHDKLGELRGFLSPGLILRETDGTIKALRLMVHEAHDIHSMRNLFCEVALDSAVMALCCLTTFERG